MSTQQNAQPTLSQRRVNLRLHCSECVQGQPDESSELSIGVVSRIDRDCGARGSLDAVNLLAQFVHGERVRNHEHRRSQGIVQSRPAFVTVLIAIDLQATSNMSVLVNEQRSDLHISG